MTFLLGVFTGILVVFAFAGVACVFIVHDRDDDLEQMQSWYESNYGEDGSL